MTLKNLSLTSFPSLAIATGAVTPNPGINGVIVYSTVAGQLLRWIGTAWLPMGAGFVWSWANAAARLAQAVVAADVGCLGFQADMARSYRLISASPVRWLALPPDDVAPEAAYYAIASGSAAVPAGIGLPAPMFAQGTATARTRTGTLRGSNLARWGNVSAAGASQFASFATPSASLFGKMNGFRAALRWTLSTTTPGMLWYAGFALQAGLTGSPADFSGLASALGLGFKANTQGLVANVGLMQNDASGEPTITDLGATWPGLFTPGQLIDMEYYLPPGGDRFAMAVRNVDTGAEFSVSASGALLPDFSSAQAFGVCAATGGADTGSVGFDLIHLGVRELSR